MVEVVEQESKFGGVSLGEMGKMERMGGLLLDFAKKSILVTGAGQGMGNKLAKDLASVGAKVIAVDKNKEGLEELACEFEGIKTIDVDLTDWKATREKLKDVGQKLDGLVNLAGVYQVKPFLECTEEDFDFAFNINIRGLFHVTQAIVPQMNECSSIVNMSSICSQKVYMDHTVYSASKQAVDAFTRTLALELAPKHIRVNSIHPSVVMTDMTKQFWSNPKNAEPLLARIPMHRFCEMEEVMDTICYFLGPRSSFVNGHHLLLDGGYSAA